jgi:hypothetical protein
MIGHRADAGSRSPGAVCDGAVRGGGARAGAIDDEFGTVRGGATQEPASAAGTEVADAGGVSAVRAELRALIRADFAAGWVAAAA